MSTFRLAVKFFQDSGVPSTPASLIMAIGLAIAIERFIFLNRARSENRKLWAQGAADAAERQVQGGARRHRRAPTPRSARSSPTAWQRMQSPGRREDIDARWRKA